MREWKETFAKTGEPFDLVGELSKVHQRIFQLCAFGRDLGEIMIDYYENGKVTKKNAGDFLRDCVHALIVRMTSP